MENVIIVDEKYSKYWVWGMTIGISLSLILYVFSNTTSNVILGNYLQLGAFVSVAAAIFSVIKLWEGKKNIKVSLENQNLIVDIHKKEDTVQRDSYELKKVDHIYLVPSQISIPFLNIFIDRKNASTFQLQLNNEDEPFYLFQFSGQIISVSNEAAERLSAFLEAQQIQVSTPR